MLPGHGRVVLHPMAHRRDALRLEDDVHTRGRVTRGIVFAHKAHDDRAVEMHMFVVPRSHRDDCLYGVIERAVRFEPSLVGGVTAVQKNPLKGGAARRTR